MFNREMGEFIEALGPHYRVAPNSKWTGSPFMDEAAQSAATNFAKAGMLRPIKFYDENILIQEYPTLRPPKLVFIFGMEFRGIRFYDTFTWSFEPDAVGELKANGMWDESMPGNARAN